MARRVFFSFHYEHDAQRAAVVRNHAVTKAGEEVAGYVDKAAWESIERQGDAAIRKWIDEQLSGTSVTVVLVGAETSSRRWVQYEIEKSYSRGNGLLAVTLHNIKDFDGRAGTAGSTNFRSIGKDISGWDVHFTSVAETHDWVNDDGYNNFRSWVEKAAKAVGR
jgi:hypothetical protein